MELPGEDDVVPLDDVADHHLLLDLRPVLQLQHGSPQHRHVQRAVNPGPAGGDGIYWQRPKLDIEVPEIFGCGDSSP